MVGHQTILREYVVIHVLNCRERESEGVRVLIWCIRTHANCMQVCVYTRDELLTVCATHLLLHLGVVGPSNNSEHSFLLQLGQKCLHLWLYRLSRGENDVWVLVHVLLCSLPPSPLSLHAHKHTHSPSLSLSFSNRASFLFQLSSGKFPTPPPI